MVENFMLINDSSTIACEVPVWFCEKNLDIGISGHIDILQIRNGLIYVLDFKPGAKREKDIKVASQLFLYASGLSFRTGIPLDRFRCAWFDDSIYYEFNPRDAEIRFPGSKWRSNKEKKTTAFWKTQQPDSGKDYGFSGMDWNGLKGNCQPNIGNVEVMRDGLW